MIKILFVCHGNICRSPMAEFIMKKFVKDAGREQEFEIASAATSTEEIGNPVYPPAKRILAEHGISCHGKTAIQMKHSDYDYYDILIGMDDANIRNMIRISGGDPQKKIHLMMSYVGQTKSVADPWYTDDFQATWDDVTVACQALLNSIPRK